MGCAARVVEGYLSLGGYQAYTAGYSMVRWIADEFGPERVPAIMRRMATSRDPRTAFTAELGVTLDELLIRWERHLKRYYWPEIGRRELVDEVASRLTEHVRERALPQRGLRPLRPPVTGSPT